MEKLYSAARGDTAVPSSRLTRKPDVALFGIDVSVDDLAAVPAFEVLSGALRKLASLLPQDAVLTPEDFDVPSIPGLLKAEASAARHSARISVPLDVNATFEKRAARVAAVDDLLRTWVLDGKKARPPLTIRRQRPVFVLSDAALEAVRAELVAQWGARVKELEPFGAVKVKDVRMTSPVKQTAVGLDAVEVTLELGGVATVKLPAR